MNSILGSKRFAFYIALILLIQFSCEKEKDYPAFGSMNLEPLNNSVYLASIEVLSTGEFKIVDHGFYYLLSTSDPGSSYLGSYKKSLGRTIESDTISTLLVPDFSGYSYYDNLKLFARAYITDEHGTVYSNYFSAPVLKLSATTISPLFAGPGDTINIAGMNFNTDPLQNKVTFNNRPGTVIYAGSNSLSVVVPTEIPFDYSWANTILVKIISGNQTTELNSMFYLKPLPEGFSPATGTWEQMITINGSGLNNCSLYLNNQQVSFYNNDYNSLTFYIPPDFLYKKFKIYVKSSGMLFEVPGGFFTMKDMDLTVAGNKFYPGQSMFINGTGFNPYVRYNKLFLDNYEIECSSAYSNLQFDVPDQIATGTYPVRVSNTIDTLLLPETITIIRPSITEVSGYTGYPGASISISGTDLFNGDFSPSLNLGGYSFSPKHKSQTLYEFEVPLLPPGEYNLYLGYGAFTLEAPQSFTVLEPVVNSIVPSEGGPGTSVVINGQGFLNSYANSVYFGNIQTPIMSMSDTQINVRVPDSLSAGIWMVQVYLAGRRLSTSVNFTVQ